MRSRLAVIVVADLVGYSRLMGADETSAIAAVRELRETYLEPAVTAGGGEVLKHMGDGWIIAFGSVPAAVEAAVKVQEGVAGHPVLKLRVGAHIGEITEDGTDFYGAGVNLAQRLQAEAPPGGLMVSQDVYRQLTGKLADLFEDAGSFKLKNIALPVNGYLWRPSSSGAAGTGDVPTVAVEMFEFAPDTSDTRAAAADLRDQLVLCLSRRTGIRVLDDLAGTAAEPTYILRGRLRLSGGQGRLTLTMVLRDEARPVFSQNYQGDTSDIFRFCDELIGRADSDLRIQINAFDGDRIAHLKDSELSVSELRARAANAFYRATYESWTYALHLLDRAVGLNPADPMALAMRANAVLWLAAARYETLPPDRVAAIEADLNTAVETAPRSDYLFHVRGVLNLYAKGDADAGIRDGERVIALSPNYELGILVLGIGNLLKGRSDDAVALLRKSVAWSDADRFLPHRLFTLAVAEACAERPAEAVATLDQAIQINPNQWGFHTLKAICAQDAGDAATAAAAAKAAAGLERTPAILASRTPVPPAFTSLMDRLDPGKAD